MSQYQLLKELERLSNEAFMSGYAYASNSIDDAINLIVTGDEPREEKL